MSGTAAGLGALLLCLACATPGEPERGQLRLATAEASFALAPTAAVGFAVTNPGSDTAFAAACGSRLLPAIEREAAGVWRPYAGDVCPAVFAMAPLPVAPGATLPGVVSIAEAGRYRLRLAVGSTRAWAARPDALSNDFTVR